MQLSRVNLQRFCNMLQNLTFWDQEVCFVILAVQKWIKLSEHDDAFANVLIVLVRFIKSRHSL